MKKKNGSSIILGGSQRNKDSGPPYITSVLSAKQQLEVREALAAEGIGHDQLKDCAKVKPVLKKLSFIKKASAVPGSPGSYLITMAGRSQQTALGDLSFAVRESP